MHEISLVRSLISQVQCAAEPSMPGGIQSIRVRMGALAGVEPLLVQAAFDAMKTSAGMPNCELIIEVQELRAHCQHCGIDFSVLDFVFRCPDCRSSSVRITQGDQFRLVNIDVAESIPAS